MKEDNEVALTRKQRIEIQNQLARELCALLQSHLDRLTHNEILGVIENIKQFSAKL